MQPRFSPTHLLAKPLTYIVEWSCQDRAERGALYKSHGSGRLLYRGLLAQFGTVQPGIQGTEQVSREFMLSTTVRLQYILIMIERKEPRGFLLSPSLD
jgi:hypothetical protein